MEDEEAHTAREEVAKESGERGGEGGREVVEGLISDELGMMEFRGALDRGDGKLDLGEMIDREFRAKRSVRSH